MKNNSCVIIGASHAGVNFAFALRKEGWEGEIHLFDQDPTLPYHRPPLSKAYLTSSDSIDKNTLKAAESYEKEQIQLHLGRTVSAISREQKTVSLANGEERQYDKLVIATGARPIIPPIEGIHSAHRLFSLRTAADVANIRKAMDIGKRVVIIGGGYIGLETAASLKKLGAQVTVLEREPRILARVTAPVLSQFFQNIHAEENVQILTNKNVVSIKKNNSENTLHCSDGSTYKADLIIVGVGIHVNTELADAAGLDLENGIKVDSSALTND
ncbi:MAG: FAD-dependent oxidoreductase, partial [Bacteroidota bacterium]